MLVECGDTLIDCRRADCKRAAFDNLAVVQVRVLFFGLLKDICGGAEARLDLPPGSTTGSVFDHYAAAFPKLRQMASSIVLARNQEFAATAEPLAEGEEIAMLATVTGG